MSLEYPATVGILGAGGFAKEVKWLIDSLAKYGVTAGCFIDKVSGPDIAGLPVIIIEQFNHHHVVCGIGGTSKLRTRVVDQALARGLDLISLVHPGALLGNNISIGAGTIICAGNILTTDIVIGRLCQINLACTIGHDCIIGDNVIISPGCNISGKVAIGDGAYIGTGARILEDLTIGKDAIVGAGAVVTKSVPEGMVAVGIPAKVVKRRDEG